MRKLLCALLLGAAGLAAAQTVDRAQLLADVRTLAAPAFEGRRAGSAGSLRAQDYLVARLREAGVVPFGADYRQRFRLGPRLQAANLIGFIPGTGASERVLVVSAHYDHLGIWHGKLYPGADDNASGVAGVLQVAAWLRAHPPAHTVWIVLFDAEEAGLKGAMEFFEHLPVPRERIGIDLNLDMIGRSAERELYAVGTWRRRALKRFVEEGAAGASIKVLAGHDWPDTGEDDWTLRSDAGVFHDEGLPYLSLSVEQHADYHGTGDIFEHIDPDFLEQAALVAVRTALALDRGLDTIRR
ncbi:MAG TPA: M20/M25/M40 family metallo-hydrolase [Telluria sp.]|nr:M20/M25/M40 family metallo-hydrolase [Telluria sp.]